MAWLSTVSGFGSTLNLSLANGTEATFLLRRLLLETGAWTSVKDSDGTTYSATGSQLTHHGSGAGGLNNNNAWFVLRDATGRQLLFQRGSLHYSWKVYYSKAAGFVEGSPAATATPTATDVRYVSNTSDAYISLFPSSGSLRCNAFAQTTPHNTCYSFNLICRVVGTGAVAGSIFMHALDEALSYGADGDPCVLLADAGTLAATTGAALGSETTAKVRGWQRYGEVDGDFGPMCLHYLSNDTPKTRTGSPYLTNPVPLDPTPVGRYGGTAPGRKGRLKYLAYVCDSTVNSWGDLIEDASGGVWLAVDNIALAGWPDTSTVPLG
jgi:hypothetical protein